MVETSNQLAVGTTKTATLAPNVPSGYIFPVVAGPTDIAKAYSGVKNEVSDDEYFGGDDYEAVCELPSASRAGCMSFNGRDS